MLINMEPCSCSNSLLTSSTDLGMIVSPFCLARSSSPLTCARYLRYSRRLIFPPPRPAAFIWSLICQRRQSPVGLTSLSCSRQCRLVISLVCPLCKHEAQHFRITNSLCIEGVDTISKNKTCCYEQLLLTLLVSVGALSERQLLLNHYDSFHNTIIYFTSRPYCDL